MILSYVLYSTNHATCGITFRMTSFKKLLKIDFHRKLHCGKEEYS